MARQMGGVNEGGRQRSRHLLLELRSDPHATSHFRHQTSLRRAFNLAVNRSDTSVQTNKQHRCHRASRELLGDTSHEQSVNSLSPVRTQHEEISTDALRSPGDCTRDIAEVLLCVIQCDPALHVTFFRLRLGQRKEFLSLPKKLIVEFGLVTALNDVKDLQSRVHCRCKRYGFI